ncbi:MAG: hypothetical protein HYY31_06850 [Chloroflexi bacterium]|nr:hypothetical protein [Chloroflexota bacterium]
MYKSTVAGLVLAVLLSVLMPTWSAFASGIWCMDDPVLRINGHTVNVEVAVPEANLGQIDGTIISVNVYGPKDTALIAEGELLKPDGTGTGIWSSTTIQQNGPAAQAVASVVVPGPVGSFPVQVTVKVDGQVVASETGGSGRWVTVQFRAD